MSIAAMLEQGSPLLCIQVLTTFWATWQIFAQAFTYYNLGDLKRKKSGTKRLLVLYSIPGTVYPSNKMYGSKSTASAVAHIAWRQEPARRS